MTDKQVSIRSTRNYKAAKLSDWTGRPTSVEVGKQYWHQHIELVDLNAIDSIDVNGEKPAVALLGYACNEGVRRNLGRTGAEDGPAAFRRRISKLAFHHESKVIVDLGDVVCENQDLEGSQEALALMVERLIQQSIFPILIGGGHDIAYGHFQGIWKAVKCKESSKIGILNFDAHFDLRPIESLPNSGTPFNQILEEYGSSVEYFVLGIQKEANTKALFEIAESKNVNYLLNYECDHANVKTVLEHLTAFVERNDYLYISIDMDGFSSAYAPGVSAPSPLGFTPYFVLKILDYLFETGKVISCDIAELNPQFDRDQATANLVGRIVDFIVGRI